MAKERPINKKPNQKIKLKHEERGKKNGVYEVQSWPKEIARSALASRSLAKTKVPLWAAR